MMLCSAVLIDMRLSGSNCRNSLALKGSEIHSDRSLLPFWSGSTVSSVELNLSGEAYGHRLQRMKTAVGC
jgi:hypothetical protein